MGPLTDPCLFTHNVHKGAECLQRYLRKCAQNEDKVTENCSFDVFKLTAVKNGFSFMELK